MTKKISTQCVSVSHGVSIVCGEGAVKPKQTNNPPVGLAGIFFTNDVCNAHAYARTMALVSKKRDHTYFFPEIRTQTCINFSRAFIERIPTSPKTKITGGGTFYYLMILFKNTLIIY
jgi:hypothetical protein